MNKNIVDLEVGFNTIGNKIKIKTNNNETEIVKEREEMNSDKYSKFSFRLN